MGLFNKKNKIELSRGGVIVSPRRKDTNQKIDILIRLCVADEWAITEAYNLLTNKGYVIDEPDYAGLIFRLATSTNLTINSIDCMALLMVAGNLELTIIEQLELPGIIRKKMFLAMLQYMPEQDELSDEEIKKINTVETIREAMTFFLSRFPQSPKSTESETSTTKAGEK